MSNAVIPLSLPLSQDIFIDRWLKIRKMESQKKLVLMKAMFSLAELQFHFQDCLYD